MTGRSAILVNRGWVPRKLKEPETRQRGQVEGQQHVVGILRNGDKRKVVPGGLAPHAQASMFTPDNRPEQRDWHWVDLPALANATGAKPVLIDAGLGIGCCI